jgi:hypothetical protein
MRYIFPLVACFMLCSFVMPGNTDQQLLTTSAKAVSKLNASQSFGPMPLNYTNSSIDTYGLQFYNISSGHTYYFTVQPNSSGTLGTIPEGYYNVTFEPYDPFLWHSYLVSCGSSAGHKGLITPTYTFYNVLYDIDICNYLQMSDM